MSTQPVLEFSDNALVPLLFGEHNSHLTYLEKKLGLDIADRGGKLSFSGDPHAIKTAHYVLKTLWEKLENDQNIGPAGNRRRAPFFQ